MKDIEKEKERELGKIYMKKKRQIDRQTDRQTEPDRETMRDQKTKYPIKPFHYYSEQTVDNIFQSCDYSMDREIDL